MSDELLNREVYEYFNPLWSDVTEHLAEAERPLLAHYSTISTLEKILVNDEIWFSNPLLMNDVEELQYGITLAARMFTEHVGIRKVCEREDRYQKLRDAFISNYNDLDQQHAFDTYALCFSEHDETDNDGLLSMWRGYGGNGKGAALVFDSSTIPLVEESPMIMNKVMYLSAEERTAWIQTKLDQFIAILSKSNVRDDKLFLAAHSLFERFKIFALFTKHPGFSEEREWRVVYLAERDTHRRLHSMLDYSIGPNGIEPKLKFKIGPVDGVTGEDLSLENLIDRIIIGPSGSGALERHAIRRMIEKAKKPAILDKLVRSSTPFRAI